MTISSQYYDVFKEHKGKAADDNAEAEVIGSAYKSDDVWFFSQHHKLYLVNVWRLSEVSLYKKLKAEHQLPVKPCDPMSLDASVVSQDGFSVLENLARQNPGYGTFFHITDERLLYNGFDIKCHCDPNGNFTCELVGLSSVVPAYDLKDLNKVLDILTSKPEALLSETRTLKAAYYLQGEAVRMTRQNVVQKSAQDVQSLLQGSVTNLDQPCLHHKPIFKELMDLTTCDFESD